MPLMLRPFHSSSFCGSVERDGVQRRPDQRRADVGADVHDPAAGAAAPDAGLRVVLRAGRRLRRRHVLG